MHGMEPNTMGIPRVSRDRCEKKFHVSCKTADENQFCVGTESISVTVGQLIHRDGRAVMWDSLGVYAEEDRDGTLIVRVMVFNPDWDEPLQIAWIRSRPGDASMNMTALGCNLDHVTV
jgi:hypothetical protein